MPSLDGSGVVASIAEGYEGTLPHMKCIVETHVIGDDRLIRSELITILQVMRGRLHTRYPRSHIVAPARPLHSRLPLPTQYLGVYQPVTLTWWTGHAVLHHGPFPPARARSLLQW